MDSKIKKISSLDRISRKTRSRKMKIVFTNGCFDILHVGHVEYLKKAKSLGDILIVGLNGDKSVRKIKGDSRPINNANDRARVLEALQCVDYITIFNDETPEKIIEILKPDVLAKGGDWKVKDIVGGDFVKKNGGRVVAIPFVHGYSTTRLIERISL